MNRYQVEVFEPGAGSVKPMHQEVSESDPTALLLLVFHWSALGYAVRLSFVEEPVATEPLKA